MHIHKILSWILTLCIFIIAVPAFAEESEIVENALPTEEQEALFHKVQPLVDLTLLASLRCSDQPYEIQLNSDLSDRFTETLFALGTRSFSELALDDTYLGNTSLQDTWLTANYLSPHALPSNKVRPMHEDEYTGVSMITCQLDESGTRLAILGEAYSAPKRFDLLDTAELGSIAWLDTKVAVTLQKDDHAMTGWKLATLLYVEDPSAEDTDITFDQSSWSTYFDEVHGFSVMYPSVFSPDMITKQTDGISGSLPDNHASFFIHYEDRNGRSLKDVAAIIQTAHSEAITQLDEAEDLAYVQVANNSQQTVWIVRLTLDGIITVSLTWDSTQAPDLSSYAGIMIETLLFDNQSNG